jgi:formiminoglutamate deiminase
MAWLGGPTLASGATITAQNGVFTSIASSDPQPGAVRLKGVVLPGLVNAHSHAFHRLLRGRTHRQGGDFWMWRDRMYEIAASLTSESYQDLATAVFIEMAMAGVTAVGEFHYLHHQMGGVPYVDRNEMGHALIRAARRAGIRIALLDAGYFTAGFGDEPLSPVQTRFSDQKASVWLDRVADLQEAYQDSGDVVVGLAPHSVRAVPEAILVELSDRAQEGTPLHIHVSEQLAENRECLEATTLTPAALLDRVGLLGPATTLVHATHVNDTDIELIATSGAGVCYCATTERDLADGVGPAADLASAGISLCVGSDSHAVIDLFEEARGIELHARLSTGRRGVFSPHELAEAATVTGSASLGLPPAGLVEGSPADFIVIDTNSPRLAGLTADAALDSILFAATADDVREVFVGGRQIVADGVHPAWGDARKAIDDGWALLASTP